MPRSLERQRRHPGQIPQEAPGRSRPYPAIPARPPAKALLTAEMRELDVREVVRLDRPLEARVELLDLPEDALRLRLFRGNRRIGECRNGSQREDRGQRDD
jgi:hypothetical protein